VDARRRHFRKRFRADQRSGRRFADGRGECTGRSPQTTGRMAENIQTRREYNGILRYNGRFRA